MFMFPVALHQAHTLTRPSKVNVVRTGNRICHFVTSCHKHNLSLSLRWPFCFSNVISVSLAHSFHVLGYKGLRKHLFRHEQVVCQSGADLYKMIYWSVHMIIKLKRGRIVSLAQSVVYSVMCPRLWVNRGSALQWIVAQWFFYEDWYSEFQG